MAEYEPAENVPGSYERFMRLFGTGGMIGGAFFCTRETARSRQEAETFEEVLARTDTSALEPLGEAG